MQLMHPPVVRSLLPQHVQPIAYLTCLVIRDPILYLPINGEPPISFHNVIARQIPKFPA